MKRCFDILASIIGLAVLSPFMIGCAVLVKLTSEGPIFFKQQRLGLGGKHFNILKFRSMVVNAENHGARVTADGDKRITRIGRILRKTKMDELPQLINVLKGEMSFVGPRPEVQEFVDCYPEEYKTLLTVRPGITDIGSIEFRDEEEILAASENPKKTYIEDVLPQKIELGKRYIDDHSILFDIQLIFRTLVAIVFKKKPGNSD